VQGQLAAKRGLLIAAAGAHNLLLFVHHWTPDLNALDRSLQMCGGSASVQMGAKSR
jgi:hypothetical protein